MKPIMKKVSTIILVLAFGIMVSGGAVIASDENPGYAALMEINDDNLISIAEDLKILIHTKLQHLDLYSASPEIIELGQETDELFAGSCENAYVLPVEYSGVLGSLLPTDEIEEYDLYEDVLSMIDQRIGNALVNNLIALKGANYIALSSMVMSSRSFVADLDQEILVVLEYDGGFSLVTDFFSSGEHVMTAVETIIPSEKVTDLLEMIPAAQR